MSLASFNALAARHVRRIIEDAEAGRLACPACGTTIRVGAARLECACPEGPRGSRRNEAQLVITADRIESAALQR